MFQRETELPFVLKTINHKTIVTSVDVATGVFFGGGSTG